MSEATVDVTEAAGKFSEDSANPIERFFAIVLPLVAENEKLAEQYEALTADTGDAVKSFLDSTDNEQVKELVSKRDQYLAAIEKINETLSALANEHIAKTVGNGKSPDSIKREWQDNNAKINDLSKTMRDVFEMMGYVSSEKPEAAEGKRPRAVYKSNGSEYGDLLIAVLDRPSLSASAPVGEGKKIREWWEKNAESIGVEYQTRGKIPDAVKDAYSKAA